MNRMIRVAVITTFAIQAQASPLPDYPLVFAVGSAKTQLTPDICVVAFRITIRDEDPTNALTHIEQRSAEALGILSNSGVRPEDVVGYEINKDRVRDYQNRERLEFLGYEMKRRIEFTLRDLAQYEPILSNLLKTPDVVDVRTSFDRTDRNEIESRLLAEAVADATAKAELMAAGSQQRIVRLRAISQSGFYNLAERFGLGNVQHDVHFYHSPAREERELLFVPSTIEFANSVSLIYEIEEDR